jgi:Asp-tRNA(Asn)/Glu-tRNA(Gln) amidotransferase A subunit family amidase
MPITAPRLDAVPEDYRLLLMPYNSPAALLGLPALSAPCGFVEGLPIGLALTGRPGEDGTPLAAARAFQQATDWHTKRPERALARVAA